MDRIEANPTISVDAWFDARCPWCYIGKVRLDRAVARYRAKVPGARVKIRHRSFYLAPDMPSRYSGGEAEYLHEFEGVPLEQARRSLPALERVADSEGIELSFEGLQLVNTTPSHRVFQYAESQGAGEVFLARLFLAYFAEHRDLSSPAVLGELAAAAGLDIEAAARAASDETWDQTIRQEWRRAQMLGVNGVPYFLFNAKYKIRGAIDTDGFERALERIRELEMKPDQVADITGDERE